MASLYLNSALESAVVGSTVSLEGEDAKHAVTVARTRVGERLSIGNGRGLIVSGAVASLLPFELAVDSVVDQPRPSPELWLVQALAKGDRDELAVQAATELGASGVIPWAAERSVTRWDAAKAEKGRARWESIAREASKQSIRAWVPDVESVVTTKAIAGTVFVLDPTASDALSTIALPEDGRILLVVGPEGGISQRELEQLEQGGARRVRLGDEILRTSTAGPAAIAVLNARLGRW
jgi:16S rRNA (uracil1498-N3)-methyltransferase